MDGELFEMDEYDENGDRIKKVTKVYGDAYEEKHYTNEYDVNGNLVKVTETSADGDDTKEAVTISEYDENGNKNRMLSNLLRKYKDEGFPSLSGRIYMG